MDEKTAKALEASIKHWKENAEVERLIDARTGVFDCALCGLFFGKVGCKGCPIAARTGRPACRGTPYADAITALDLDDLDSFREAALAEVAFLESLRETPNA